jgi:hypothetical protein
LTATFECRCRIVARVTIAASALTESSVAAIGPRGSTQGRRSGSVG